MKEALEFFVERMGFTVTYQAGGVAGVRRDDVAFNLVESNDRAWIENTSCSIGVSNLTALHEEYRTLPAKVGPLEMKIWGRREFHMVIPSGVCLQFYQVS